MPRSPYMSWAATKDFYIAPVRTWRLCPCGKPEEDCARTAEEHATIKWAKDREAWTAMLAVCRADPRWIDPAPFPVPRRPRTPPALRRPQ